MNDLFNNRTYVVIPIEKIHQSVKADISHGRKRLNGRFLIWDEKWDPETLEKMKRDPGIKLLTHEQALELVATKEWRKPLDLGHKQEPIKPKQSMK